MNEHDFNQPYAAPQPLDSSNFGGNTPDGYLGEAQAVPAGNATSWLGNAWAIFKQQPGLWVGAGVVYLLINLVLAFIPLAGGLLQMFITVYLGAGFVYAASRVEQEGQFALSDIFAGFQTHGSSLGMLTLLSLLYFIALMVVFFVLAMIGGLLGGGTEDSVSGALMAIIIIPIIILTIPYAAALYLAPILVILQNETPVNAIKLSWQAFIRNIGGALICTLLMALVSLVAMIPLGLGLLVGMPLLLIVPYVVYRDVFFE